MKRVAVSDHILLGGDNIDLAIAHLLEKRLATGENGLSAGQWDHLVARCRSLKERALSSEAAPDEVFTVSIPGGARACSPARCLRGDARGAGRAAARRVLPRLRVDRSANAASWRIREWGCLTPSTARSPGILPRFCAVVPASTPCSSTAARCIPPLARETARADREMAAGPSAASAGERGARSRGCARRGLFRPAAAPKCRPHRGGRRSRGFS